MSDFWEPWAPGIGQRVRVSVSPECQTHRMGTDAHLIEAVNGRTGTVTAWPDWVLETWPSMPPGHPYLVALDDPIDGIKHLAICAAAELEAVS